MLKLAFIAISCEQSKMIEEEEKKKRRRREEEEKKKLQCSFVNCFFPAESSKKK